MTNREGISIVKRLFREVNADSHLTDKSVYSLMMKHSRWLVYRESEKMKLTRTDSVYQIYKCVEVIEAPAIDPCCGIRTKCKVYRTKDKLPTLYEDSIGMILSSVMSVDNSQTLTTISLQEWQRKVDNPWIKNRDMLVIPSDGYLYFPVDPNKKGHTPWKRVNVSGLYETDISHLNLCDTTPDGIDQTKECYPFLDRRFIIPKNLEAQMFDAVMKDLANTYERTPERSQRIDKKDNSEQ